MSALVKKEIRLLLPAWIAATMLALSPLLLGWFGYRPEFIFLPFAFALVAIAVGSFGQEFGFGTFSSLLVQPIPRSRIWRTKVILLLVAEILSLALLAGATCAAYHLPRIEASVPIFGSEQKLLFANSGLFLAAALTGGLWTTLLLRQTATALWVTLLTPTAILLSLVFILPRQSDAIVETVAMVLILIYSILGFLWARRLFMRAQDYDWTGGVITFQRWRTFESSTIPPQQFTRRTPFGALLRKEFQSHHINLLIALALLAVHLGIIMGRAFSATSSHSDLHVLLEFGWVLWLVMPLVVGSMAVAEERKFGTLESLLCLPVNRRLQWLVKLGMTLALGVFLGGIMPWLLESVAARLGAGSPLNNFRIIGFFFQNPLAQLCFVSALVTFVSFYASTLTRSLLQAIGFAFLIFLGLSGVAVWSVHLTSTSGRDALWENNLALLIGGPVVLLALLRLEYKNFQRVGIGWRLWIRNLIIVCAVIAFSLTAAGTIYNRTWELFMKMEPQHGSAELKGSVRPKILDEGGRVLVLLPDSRVWVETNSQWKSVQIFQEHGLVDGEEKSYWSSFDVPVPTQGTFLGSNWVELASSRNSQIGVAGLLSDGSLWRIFFEHKVGEKSRREETLKTERIGTDSDWKKIAGGGGFFVALKTNGTLWGFVNNEAGVLAPSSGKFMSTPVRIGTNSDWANIFVSWNTFIGVKRDGSVWKWGGLNFGPNGEHYWEHHNTAHPEPIRWNLDGSGWIEHSGNPNCDLVLRQDGSLWIAGQLPESVLGHNFYRKFSTALIRVGHDSDWVQISGDWNSVIALKENGTLVEQFEDHVRTPSSHPDWIGIGGGWGETFALAADGTLSFWMSNAKTSKFLGPSRKPLWSINILTGETQ